MRIYRVDGSFIEDEVDTEFGWNFNEIVIDEAQSNFQEINKEIRLYSNLRKTFKCPFPTTSMDSIVEETDEYIRVEKLSPDVEIQPILGTINCETVLEGTGADKNEENEYEHINLDLPSKEDLVKMINPCNSETKMLLSVIYFSKYKTLVKEEASEELLKSVNFKTINFKCLMGDQKTDIVAEIYQEIKNYHATKEDNMLSLMMELVLTDTECNVDDIMHSDRNEADPKTPQFVFETSDLGNSLPSSTSSKGDNHNVNLPQKMYRQPSSRSHILSSIGLADEERSIQSFCDETYEMHQELAAIKRSFQEDENRVAQLIKQANALEREIKETLHLDDILHLLEGDLDRVRLKKLPFRIFHGNRRDDSCELNLIV